MSQLQYEQTVKLGVEFEIEQVIQQAQCEPITPDQAALLRWATGTSTKENQK
jgi:hypothetical protein